MKLRVITEDENNDMYYRLSYIDDTDKLIKDFNRRWEDFKNTSPESFNVHVKNNAQELRDKVWDALNALIRATKATKLGEAVNENYWDDYQEYLKNPESHPEISKYVVTPEMWKEEARYTIEYFFNLGPDYYNVASAISLILMVLIMVSLFVMNKFSDSDDGGVII
jgi:hypothetical protein